MWCLIVSIPDLCPLSYFYDTKCLDHGSKCTSTAIYVTQQVFAKYIVLFLIVLLDFSLTVKAAPHECEIRTSQL